MEGGLSAVGSGVGKLESVLVTLLLVDPYYSH